MGPPFCRTMLPFCSPTMPSMRHLPAAISPPWSGCGRSGRGGPASIPAPEIDCRNARAYLLGETAYVICYEILKGTTLVATNVFVREGGEWRIAHHQAGAAPPVSLADDKPSRLQ